MKIFSLVIALFTLACARPIYISAAEWNQQQNPATSPCPVLFPATQICGEFLWESSPSSSGYSSAKLTLSGDLSTFDDVTVLLWMPSMGHGSAPVQLQNLGSGVLHITNILFIMPGDWEVRITLKKSGQVVDQFFIPLLVP